MIADGTKANYTKKLTIRANYDLPEIDNDGDKILRHDIRSCKTELDL
jgi:hypothetical protein